MQLSTISLALTRLGGLFSPASLFAGGTVAGAWYDPSDLTTLFDTSAGTTPVAMPGLGAAVSVGRMLDKSGNGNHAIAFNNTTARPELRARVNLLTYSEQFDNAAWTAQNATVANTTATTDPFGGNTADILTDNAVNTEHRVFQTPTNTAGTYVWSFWAKANTLSWLHLGIPDAAGSRQDIYFDVGSGALGTVPAGYTATITSAGNGWWRCTVTGNTQANAYFVLSPSTANNVQSYAGTGQSLYIWGADLRPANIGANVPAYQRIADANTYDTSGFPLYLSFDGIDDLMYTPAGIGIFGNAEFVYWLGINRQTTAANNAVFGWGSSSGAGQACGQYRVSSVESVQYAGGSPFNFANGPDFRSNVFSYSKTPGAINTTSSARLNGLPNNGTGNSSTVPNIANSSLKIGQWADFPSDFFNGQLYSLIIAGSAVSAGNISATEQWVAQRTGIVIP